MFTSPVTITIGAQAFSLKLKNQDNFGAVYMDNTTVPGTEVRMDIKHAYEGKPKSVASSSGFVQSQFERHIVDLKVTKTDAQGFQKVTQSYLHIRNLRGAVVADVGDVAQALSAFITSKADDIVAWES